MRNLLPTISPPSAHSLAPALIAVALLACNGNTDTGDTDDTDGADTDVEETDEPVEDIEMRFRVRGLGIEMGSVVAPDLEGATCEWTRRTGESWDTPVTSTTDSGGFCSLMIPGDRNTVTVKVTLDDYIDVLAAGFPAREFDSDNAENTITGIVMYTDAQADGFYGLFDETRDTSNGYVTGVVTWRPTGQGTLGPIGCASIDPGTSDPGFDVYLGGTIQNPRTTTDPRVGTWLGFDIAPGSYTFTAEIEGTGLERQAVVPVLANTFTNIPLFFPAESNPTPANCE